MTISQPLKITAASDFARFVRTRSGAQVLLTLGLDEKQNAIVEAASTFTVEGGEFKQPVSGKATVVLWCSGTQACLEVACPEKADAYQDVLIADKAHAMIMDSVKSSLSFNS